MKNFAAVLCLVLALWAFDSRETLAAEKESVYDRVMRTGTIRCGYYIWPPFLVHNANSGKIEGVGVEVFEEMARLLSLKVAWAEEVRTDTMFEGYKSGRYDLLCGPVAITPVRARVADFTRPFLFSPLRLYAKADDARFDNGLAAADSASIRYALLDGEFGAIIRDESFPHTQPVALPALSSPAELMLTLATGKADITVTDPIQFLLFDRQNPGKVREVKGPPVRVVPLGYSVPPGEERLKNVLELTLDSMLETGFIARILKQNPDYERSLLLPAKRYADSP